MSYPLSVEELELPNGAPEVKWVAVEDCAEAVFSELFQDEEGEAICDALFCHNRVEEAIAEAVEAVEEFTMGAVHREFARAVERELSKGRELSGLSVPGLDQVLSLALLNIEMGF
jgi:hypothetical protein